MNYLVTGATGFIGNAITQELKTRGHCIAGLVRKTSNVEKLNQAQIPYFFGDLNDPSSLHAAISGRDAVIHTAGFVSDWGKTADYIKANYEGTRNLLEACIDAGVRRVVYFSTVDVFGGGNNVTYSETSKLQQLPGGYDKSKVMAEKLMRSYMAGGKLDITIVYPPWVYGEGDLHFVPEIVKAIQDGSMLFFRKGGEHVVEINYIGNLTEAVCTILTNDATIGQGYILADEPKVTFRYFVNTIAQQMGAKEVRFSLPYPLAYSAAFLMEALYRIFRIKSRPLLTRQAVILLGNNIIYDTSYLKATGFRQKYTFEEVMDRDCYGMKMVACTQNDPPG